VTPEERAHVGRLILDVIEKDFHADLTEVWSICVSLTETIPEQANNEIRNALNHLARAFASGSPDDAASDIRQARNHFERGKRDCLKISIIEMHDRLDSMISLVEYKYGLLPANVRQRFKIINQSRRTIYREESRGEEGVSSRLETLLADSMDLEEFILDNYNVPSAVTVKAKKFLRRAWHHAATVSLGAIIAFLGSMLFSYAFPDNDVTKGLRVVARYVFPLSAPTTPQPIVASPMSPAIAAPTAPDNRATPK
jgi:hypothetical protein